jgi:hypothetical protein
VRDPVAFEDIVQRRRPHLHLGGRTAMRFGKLARLGRHEIVRWHKEDRVTIGLIGDEQRHELRARSKPRVVAREFYLRLDGQSRPAEGDVEVVGVAELLVTVGADVDKDAVSLVFEEVANDPLFGVLRVSLGPVLLFECLQFRRLIVLVGGI